MEAPQLTLIIEWDNVRLSEIGRAKLMLQNLIGQIRQLHTALPGPGDRRSPYPQFAKDVEVLVLYNSEAIDGRVVDSIVTTSVPRDSTDFELRILPAPGMHY